MMRAFLSPLAHPRLRCDLLSMMRTLSGILVLCLLMHADPAGAQVIKPTPELPTTPSPDAAPPPPGEDMEYAAQAIGTTMPTTVVAGSTITVSVTMKNTGSTTWTMNAPEPFRLGSANPIDNLTWGVGRVSLPTTVAYGMPVDFFMTVTAPSTPGTYSFAWQMLREGGGWFGGMLSRTVTVTAPPAPVYDAQLTNASIPATMTAGSAYNVSLTFKNTGNVTWVKASNYRIGSTSPDDNVTFGRNRVDLNVATVAPGQSATFDFQVQAPSTAGNHTFDWGMLWEDQRRFGQTTARTVTVSSPVPKPTIWASLSPDPLVAGQSFTTNWGATNATSLSRVCTAAGTGYKVSESLSLNGPRTATAQAAWVGYPSSCTWTASGAGGSTSFTQTMTTVYPKPTLGITRNPVKPVAGQFFTTTWNTTNATSLSRVCTASGTGYKVSESLTVNDERTEPALAAWVGYPSSCTWTASGLGGTTTRTETMETVAPPTPKPSIEVQRNPNPAVAGQLFTTTWSTTNATSLSRVCTAAGTGYKISETVAVNDSRTEFAQAGWVAYPSSCTWTASGPGGTKTYTDTLTTVAAPTPKPTIEVTRNPAPKAGQSFTTTWSTTNATSLSRVCTASGTGYTVNESLAVSGSRTETAQAGWVAYPSSCTWTATGAGGTSTHVETMTTEPGVASSSVTYLHTDALGSPVARTNASGQVISRSATSRTGMSRAGRCRRLGSRGM